MDANKALATTITVLLLFFATPVLAQPSTSLPPPGTTPDRVTYYGEIVYEFVVGVALIPMNSKTEARYHLSLAGERIAEAQTVTDLGAGDSAVKAVDRYPAHIREAAKHAVSAKVEGHRYNERLLQEVNTAATRHRNMLGGVQSGMPQEDQGAVKAAVRAADHAIEETDAALEDAKKE